MVDAVKRGSLGRVIRTSYRVLRISRRIVARAPISVRMCQVDILRFQLQSIWVMNVVLHVALYDGGPLSLMSAAQGKTLLTALLRMEVDVPVDLLTLSDAPA